MRQVSHVLTGTLSVCVCACGSDPTDQFDCGFMFKLQRLIFQLYFYEITVTVRREPVSLTQHPPL